MSKHLPKNVRAAKAKAHIREMERHWNPKNNETFAEQDLQCSKVFLWRCPRGHEWRDKMAAIRGRPTPLCPKCRELLNKMKDKVLTLP